MDGGRLSIYGFGCSSGEFIRCCLWGFRWCRPGSRHGARLISRLLGCFRRGRRCPYSCCTNCICSRRHQGLFWDSSQALFRLRTRRYSRDYVAEWLESAIPSHYCHIEPVHTTTSNWGQSHRAPKECFELHLGCKSFQRITKKWRVSITEIVEGEVSTF